MAGLVPGLVAAIQSLSQSRREEDVDARDKRGHDAETMIRCDRNPAVASHEAGLPAAVNRISRSTVDAEILQPW
jgi:hypothetical protein